MKTDHITMTRRKAISLVLPVSVCSSCKEQASADIPQAERDGPKDTTSISNPQKGETPLSIRIPVKVILQKDLSVDAMMMDDWKQEGLRSDAFLVSSHDGEGILRWSYQSV